MKRNNLIVILLAFYFCLHAQQSFKFKHWGVEDGLSQSTITQVIQDKDGFIWLGTQDGLNRFDGYRFKVYRKKDNDTSSLSNNYVMSLVCDSTGNIWAGTTNGLNKISRSNHRVHRINLEKLFPNATNFRIHALCAAERGGVYVATSFTILYVDSAGRVFHLPEIEAVLPSGSNSLVFNGGLLFFASAKKIWQYNVKTHSTKVISAECLDISVLSTNKEKMFFKCGSSIKTYDLLTGRVANYQHLPKGKNPAPRNVQSVLQLHDEEWICTDNGLIWRKQADTLLIEHDEKNEQSLASDFVYAALKDKLGNYWIGTGRGGLCFYSGTTTVTWLEKNIGLNESVWQCLRKKDTLYLATSKGLKIYKVAQSNAKLSTERYPEKNLRELSLPLLQREVADKLVTAIDCDADGKLWLSTERNGIYVYQPKKNVVRHLVTIAGDTSTLITDRIMYLNVLNDSTVAGCTTFGVNLINTRTLNTKRVYLSSLLPGLNNYVMKATADADKIWLSSANGLCKYVQKPEQLWQYMPDEKHPEEQYHNIVSDANVNSRGDVWLSTMGYGLHYFSVSTNTFKRYGSKEGLENENLLRLQLEDSTAVWTASHDGIACFDLNKKQFYNFGEEDGFENKECTMNGFYRYSDGDYYIGTVGGLAVFDPHQLKPDTGTIHMVLSGIKINYEDYFDDSYANVEGLFARPLAITLFDKAKTIEFEFSSLRFGKTKAISYQYRLEGFDQKWVQLPTNVRIAAYTNLPEGSFKFKVVPVVNGKAVFSKMLQFDVKVVPPFYKRLWFKASAVVVLIFLTAFAVVLFYRRKLRLQKEKAEQELRLQKEKERISRELHDNVGSQLTYIIKSIDTLSYKAGKQAERVQEGLDSLSDFSRDTLNQLRESIWAINSKEITLKELEAKIQDYLVKINAGLSGIELVFTSEIVDEVVLNPTAAIGIYRIVQEALVNSIKYAGVEQIRISFLQQNDGNLVVTVVDSGKGFEMGLEKNHSYGLKNMKARAEEIGATISIESAPGKGTRIELRYRLKQ